MSVLSVRGLHKSFGGVEAVAGVDFDVAAGEMLALIGPNGAGKTTCFNMLMGQLRPDAGTVSLDGADITGLPPRAIWRRGVGRTFQITATFASMTVAENVQTALMSHRGDLGRFSRARRHCTRTMPSRCSIKSAWRISATGPAACWLTATSSASSLPWRWPTRRVCC